MLTLKALPVVLSHLEIIMFIAIDWANEEENVRSFDGTKLTKSFPKADSAQVIVTENIPMRKAQPYFEAGAKIYRCTTDQTAKYREKLGWEKTHDDDVKIIYKLYQHHPEEFREWKHDPVFAEFATLYATFKETQKTRNALGNRCYAAESEIVKTRLSDFEKLEKQILKDLETNLKTMPIYTEFLSKIKGIGPATAAGLLAYTGDIGRFSCVSKLMKCWGLDVQNGKAPRKQAGKVAKWNHKARSLVLGVIADSFVKQRSPYRDIYDKEKDKQKKICDKLIIAERRARRKMAKEFVKDYFKAYKKLSGVASRFVTPLPDLPAT